jgi:hypothetical protein
MMGVLRGAGGVETFKGVVQLSGFVSTQANISKAVEVARGAAGVKPVKNDMKLKCRTVGCRMNRAAAKPARCCRRRRCDSEREPSRFPAKVFQLTDC